MSIAIYPDNVYEETPSSFGSEIDDTCQKIHDACKGFGHDEKALLVALGSVPMEDRGKVAVRYEQMFEKNLKSVIKSECGSRSYGTTLQWLSLDPITAECKMINDSCKGLGTDEYLLITIICGRPNKEIEVLKHRYFECYTKDLGSVLGGELRGTLEQLVFNALQGMEEEYDEGVFNDEKMNDDLDRLYKMGQGQIGTDEAGLFKFLFSAPPEYVTKCNLAYAEKYGFTLMKAMENELKGTTKDAACFLMGMKMKPYEEVAKLIARACEGAGTNETLLQATLIRYKKIMNEVKMAHVELYGQTVEDRIRSETRGDYEDLLIELVGGAEAEA